MQEELVLPSSSRKLSMGGYSTHVIGTQTERDTGGRCRVPSTRRMLVTIWATLLVIHDDVLPTSASYKVLCCFAFFILHHQSYHHKFKQRKKKRGIGQFEWQCQRLIVIQCGCFQSISSEVFVVDKVGLVVELVYIIGHFH